MLQRLWKFEMKWLVLFFEALLFILVKAHDEIWTTKITRYNHPFVLFELQKRGLVDVLSHIERSPGRYPQEVSIRMMPKNTPVVKRLFQMYSLPLHYKKHRMNLEFFADTPDTTDHVDIFGGYYTSSKLYDFYNELLTKYSDHMKIEKLKETEVLKNRILLITFDNIWNETKPTIFIQCGIHAREWITVSFCTYLIHALAHSKESKVTENILNKYQIQIIPIVNVDGYDYSLEQKPFWRKNLHNNRDTKGCNGVDINRNFKTCYYDNFDEKNHQNTSTCSDIYPGEFPFSEPETRMLRDAVKRLKNPLAYFDMHAYGLLWMYPYACENKSALNWQEMDRVAKTGADALLSYRGTKYTIGAIYNVIYPAYGSAVDYMYDEIGFKYSYVIEMPDKGEYGFHLPPTMIQPVLEETLVGILTAIEAI